MEYGKTANEVLREARAKIIRKLLRELRWYNNAETNKTNGITRFTLKSGFPYVYFHKWSDDLDRSVNSSAIMRAVTWDSKREQLLIVGEEGQNAIVIDAGKSLTTDDLAELVSFFETANVSPC